MAPTRARERVRPGARNRDSILFVRRLLVAVPRKTRSSRCVCRDVVGERPRAIAAELATAAARRGYRSSHRARRPGLGCARHRAYAESLDGGRSGWLGGLFTLDRPGYSELIFHDPEPARPERFLEWHPDLAVFRKCPKHTLCHHRVVHLKHKGKTLWLLVPIGREVPALYNGVADFESAVIDLPAPIRRYIGGHWGLAPSQHERDCAVQATLVEPERSLALPVEGERDVQIEFHRFLARLSLALTHIVEAHDTTRIRRCCLQAKGGVQPVGQYTLAIP